MIELEEIKRQVLEVVEPYTRVSSLHNYGPSGISREEKAEIRTGTFIMEDLINLFEILASEAHPNQIPNINERGRE